MNAAVRARLARIAERRANETGRPYKDVLEELTARASVALKRHYSARRTEPVDDGIRDVFADLVAGPSRVP